MPGGPDWARTTLMERIALIEVKLYRKANAYHHKTYALYNGAHGPIRPPTPPGIPAPPPRASLQGELPARYTSSTDVPIVRSPRCGWARRLAPGLKAGA